MLRYASSAVVSSRFARSAAVFSRCSLEGSSDTSGVPDLVALTVRGEIPPEYSLFATNLTVEQIRLSLVRRPSDTLVTATRALGADSNQVSFSLPVTLNSTT